MTLKRKITKINHYPFIIKDLLSGMSKSEIRVKIHQLNDRARKTAEDSEVRSFIIRVKQASFSSYHADLNGGMKLNKLYCIEDWSTAK